jgi:hypothetical protein
MVKPEFSGAAKGAEQTANHVSRLAPVEGGQNASLRRGLAGLSGSFRTFDDIRDRFRQLLAPDLFLLPAFSSGDFFLTLSHGLLKLSDLFA